MVCRKTRLCEFNLRGACERGAKCNFAHTKEELCSTPNLQGTKLCPGLVRGRGCPDRSSCKFAHSEEELHAANAAVVRHSRLEVPGANVTAWSELSQRNLANALLPLAATSALMPKRQTSASCLSLWFQSFLAAGAVGQEEATVCLTGLFTAIFEAEPHTAACAGVSAGTLAAATVTKIWSDSGATPTDRLNVEDVLRRCGGGGGSVGSSEADTLSQLSTDDGDVDGVLNRGGGAIAVLSAGGIGNAVGLRNHADLHGRAMSESSSDDWSPASAEAPSSPTSTSALCATAALSSGTAGGGRPDDSEMQMPIHENSDDSASVAAERDVAASITGASTTASDTIPSSRRLRAVTDVEVIVHNTFFHFIEPPSSANASDVACDDEFEIKSLSSRRRSRSEPPRAPSQAAI